MSREVFDSIRKLLDGNDVQYRVLSHEPIVTAEEAAKARGGNVGESLKRGAKALILRSKGKFCQFVVPGNRKLDMKKARGVFGVKKLSLAAREEVEKVTDCTPGSVPPFGNLFSIPVFADERLAEEIVFSAGLHEKSIALSLRDWKRLVRPVVVDVALEHGPGNSARGQ